MGQIRSFSEPLDDEDGGTLGDLVKCEEFEDEFIDRMDRQQLQHELWSIVDELPDQQRDVIRSRYLYSRTMKQAGDSQGLSIERIRQIQAKALRTLRLNKYAGRLRPYLTDIQTCIAYSGNGVGNFTRTWTSSTERAVLCMEPRESEELS